MYHRTEVCKKCGGSGIGLKIKRFGFLWLRKRPAFILCHTCNGTGQKVVDEV